jgi:CcmD family protein
MMRSISAFVLSVLLLAPAAFAAQPPEPQSEFTPLSSIPQTEQIPGGTMVVVAYAFIWVALFVYVWSIWRRLGKVEGEIRTLERRTQGGASR